MGEYYLISQLPSLDGIGDEMPVPISEERFLELCGRFLKGKSFDEIKKLTLSPPLKAQSCSNDLVRSWNKGERRLRIALAKARAERLNKKIELEDRELSDELIKLSATATEAQNPLEAEKILLKYRLEFLEGLRPADHFCVDYLFYYGLKLKLLLRIREFDTALGEKVYQRIYKSVIDKDRLEAI